VSAEGSAGAVMWQADLHSDVEFSGRGPLIYDPDHPLPCGTHETARSFTVASPGTRSGEAANVGQMYALFVQAIRDGKGQRTDFATAFESHRLVDAIKQASDVGREVTTA
jgi:predicted dehydrogenase